MTDEVTSDGLPAVRRHAGDTAFAAICLLFALFLLSRMFRETAWVAGQGFAAQPGFWPRLAVIGMVLFGSLNLYRSFRDASVRERIAGVGEEVALWLRSLEYALWFMAYVFATPIVGYLAASILFAVALTVRAGFRSGRAILAAAATATVTVLLFKSFLQVKIPGGAVYEALPDGLRNFFILYL